MKLKIYKDTNPIMRKKSSEVTLPLSKKEHELLDSMLEHLKMSQNEEYRKTHKVREGVGLAAVQVGHLKRMFVIYYQKDDGQIIQYQLINPKIVETSVKKCALKNGEGCLSVDKEYSGYAHRYYKERMRAFEAIQNKNIEIVASGFDAIGLQHEYDHLDGIFFYDRIDRVKPLEQLSNEVLI